MADWEPTLELMLEHRYRALKAYAVILCGDPNEADDLVQDAIISTFSSLRRFESPQMAEGYVRRAIASRFIDGRRRAKTRRDALPVLAQDETDSGADVSTTVQQRTDMARALQTLPPRERACVVLRHLDHLSTRETARALGLSEGTVKRYLADGVGRLAPLLSTPLDTTHSEWSDVKVTP